MGLRLLEQANSLAGPSLFDKVGLDLATDLLLLLDADERLNLACDHLTVLILSILPIE